MSDPGKARDALDRAARAEALLRNELLNEAFQAIDARLIEAWRASAVDDWKGRERIYDYHRSLRGVREWLDAVVRDGAMAANDLRYLEGK